MMHAKSHCAAMPRSGQLGGPQGLSSRTGAQQQRAAQVHRNVRTGMAVSSTTTTPSAPGSATGAPNGSANGSSGNGPASAVPKVTIDMAMAAKINAARELARRLADEKQAANAAASPAGQGLDPEGLKRAAESATAEAAVQAARADALVRALRRAEASRDQLSRLRMENEALRELIMELAADKEVARARVDQVLGSLSDQGLVERAKVQAQAMSSTRQAAAAGMSASGGIGMADPSTPELEAKIVAASAEVAEFLSPIKVTDEPSGIMSYEEVEQVRKTFKQSKGGDETEEDKIKNVVKKVDSKPSSGATLASSAAVAVAQTALGAAAPTAGAVVAQALEATAAAVVAQAIETVVETVAAPPAPVPRPQPGRDAFEAQVSAMAAAAKSAMTPPAPVAAAPVIAPPRPVPPLRVPAPPQPPPPPPKPVGPPEPTMQELNDLANRAVGSGKISFTWPAAGVKVGEEMRLFYNRARGPLRPCRMLQWKAGYNKWEEIAVYNMTKTSLRASHDAEWWEVRVQLPAELWRVDYVIMDPDSQACDNNDYKDFLLPLVNAPTQEEVMARIAEKFRLFDEARIKMLDDEERRLWRITESQALDAAAAARVEFRRRRDQELLAAARLVVADRRKPEIMSVPASGRLPGVYQWSGGAPKAGERCMLAYLRTNNGPLSTTNSVRVHMGYDGWWNQIVQVFELQPLSEQDLPSYGLVRDGQGASGQWFGGFVEVPYSAAVLNFVFSDRDERLWDNNANRDYHSLVSGAQSGDELVALLHATMKRDTADKDKEVEDRAALRAVRKIESRGLVARKRRQALHELMYTVPPTPRAGQMVEVYYSPDTSMLRGRPEIWLRANWNRIAAGRPGAVSPPVVVRMEPCLPGGIGFLRASVQVPAGAWGMDLAFADNDSMQGGFVDNNGGLDYHVTVEGSNQPKAMLNVVHVACEMAPIAKVGGMGDVVTALGRAVQEQGHNVRAIIPKYDIIDYNQVEDLRQDGSFNWGNTTVRVWHGQVEGLTTTFLEPENGMFWVGCIYGRNNDAQRFGFFCGAALQYIKVANLRADVLHCHDWQSAPVAWGDRSGARCVFTIHNLSYGADMIGRAMQACDVATTVSPTYAREISGHPSVTAHLTKLYGVLNGIDTDIWDPSEDPCLPQHYTAENVGQGKSAAQRVLREKLGLAQQDVPIVGCVTRLVAQKGIHLIKHAAWRTLERGGQFVLLGSAPDGRVQGEFNALKEQLARSYPGKAALVFTYDEPLSHLIYAGSDMFLVPSMFEPCGLTQMIAMRYGTVPVVRKTGGLVDTVYDVDHDQERARQKGMETNGFSFEGTDVSGMDYALNRAIGLWYSNRSEWAALRKRAMQQDWSWNSPALDYLELYFKAHRG